jgi:hypothetical protein
MRGGFQLVKDDVIRVPPVPGTYFPFSHCGRSKRRKGEKKGRRKA